MSADQMGVFAHNSQTPIVEEQEPVVMPLEGERWVDWATNDELLYNGHGYFESVINSRLVKLMPNGEFKCQTLNKVIELTRCDNNPQAKWDSILEIAEGMGPEYVEFCHDSLQRHECDESNLRFIAVRKVEVELQDYQRLKQKPKKRKSRGEKVKELEQEWETLRDEATEPEETIIKEEQELAQSANLFLKTKNGKSPLTIEEGAMLVQLKLKNERVQQVIEMALKAGWKPEEDAATTAEATDDSSISEVEFEVDEAELISESQDSEAVSFVRTGDTPQEVEIPMLLDGAKTVAKEEPQCNAEKDGTSSQNLDSQVAETHVSEPMDSSSTQADEPTPEAKPEQPTLMQMENGQWMDVETGEYLTPQDEIDLLASVEGKQLPANTKFEVNDVETAEIYIAMIMRYQANIETAIKYCTREINHAKSKLNSLQARFNSSFKQVALKNMKRKKNGALDGKSYNTSKGTAFFTTFGGLDVYDKKEFESWVKTMDEKECGDNGVDLITKVSPVYVEFPADVPQDVLDLLEEMVPGVKITPSETTIERQANLEFIEILIHEGKLIPGVRYIEPDEAGIVKFGHAGTKGFSLNNISKMFNEAQKDVSTKYITLSELKYAPPYKIEVKKEVSSVGVKED